MKVKEFESALNMVKPDADVLIEIHGKLYEVSLVLDENVFGKSKYVHLRPLNPPALRKFEK